MFLTEGMGSRQGLPRTEGQERWKLIGLRTLVPFQDTLLSDVFHGYTLKWMWLSCWDVKGPSSSLSCPWSCCNLGAGCPASHSADLRERQEALAQTSWLWRFPSGGPSDRAPSGLEPVSFSFQAPGSWLCSLPWLAGWQLPWSPPSLCAFVTRYIWRSTILWRLDLVDGQVSSISSTPWVSELEVCVCWRLQNGLWIYLQE